jgi:hypothetical protein
MGVKSFTCQLVYFVRDYFHIVKGGAYVSYSEKDTKLAQKLDQLQPFVAVFLLECMGQLAYFGPTDHRTRSWP